MKRKLPLLMTFTFAGIVLCLFCFLVLMSGFTGCRVNFSHGSGTKIGQVIKLSKQGFLCDTWEAQLIRGGLAGGNGGFGVQPFDFTIESDELAKKVQEYMESQTEVVITYRIEGIYAYNRSESDGHFLETITPATNSVGYRAPVNQ